MQDIEIGVSAVQSPVNIIEQTLYKLMLDFTGHVQVIVTEQLIASSDVSAAPAKTSLTCLNITRIVACHAFITYAFNALILLIAW